MTWAITGNGYSQRRACRLAGLDPRVHRDRSIRPDDAGLRRRLRELSSERRLFGYRRLHILPEREGWAVNWKKVYRIYRGRAADSAQAGRPQAGAWNPRADGDPAGAEPALVTRFVTGSMARGRRFRVLCVIDDFSRECLAAVVDTSISGHPLARELDRIAELRGCPCMVVSDNGTEPTSNAILTWQVSRTSRSNGPISRPASRCRTASWKASTVGCGTNVSTSTCSPACPMPAN